MAVPKALNPNYFTQEVQHEYLLRLSIPSLEGFETWSQRKSLLRSENGTDNRAYKPHGRIPVPKDRSNIVFFKENLDEEFAFEVESLMIAYYGRIDLGEGILLNRTDGR